MMLFTLSQLHLSYGKHCVLDIPQLTIPAQGCMVLSGRNGSGKTTLLKIIAGLLCPTQATIIWSSCSQQSWQQAKWQLRRQAVYLHQHPYLFDGSVADNIAYGLRCQGLSRQDITKTVATALEWAELSHLAKRHVRCLSGGEKQRVALTRARVLAPRLLLLDEPTANMDREAKEQTYFLLRRLQTDNLSIILTSHELRNDSVIGDTHLQLENGKVSYTDTPLYTEESREQLSELPPLNTIVF